MPDPCAVDVLDTPVDDAATLASLVEVLHVQPECPSPSLRTNEGDRYRIGDGRPVVSAPRTARITWLRTGDASGIEAPSAADLPTLPVPQPDPTTDREVPAP